MILRLKPAPANRRRSLRVAGAALLVLAFAVASLPGRAEEADEFSATVSVDATADTVVKAREMARLDGQRRALAAVVERLASSAAPARLAKLDDQTITDLVASFAVANERMSAVRYLADYTFHFRPKATRRMLGDEGINIAEHPAASPGTGAPPAPGAAPPPGKSAETGGSLVIIPVYQSDGQPTLWEDPNPWRDAWDQMPAAAGPLRLVVPLGDAADIAAIDAGQARAGDGQALAAIARRNGSDAAVVALAAMRGPPDSPAGLDITVRSYRGAQSIANHSEPLSANSGESGSDLLRRAVAAITSDIEGGWKREPPANYNQEGSLTAVLPIASLDDWVSARGRLAAVPVIRNIALVALSRQQATIEIDYVGSIDQLKMDLAEISLDLIRGDPLWRLARGGPGRAP